MKLWLIIWIALPVVGHNQQIKPWEQAARKDTRDGDTYFFYSPTKQRENDTKHKERTYSNGRLYNAFSPFPSTAYSYTDFKYIGKGTIENISIGHMYRTKQDIERELWFELKLDDARF